MAINATKISLTAKEIMKKLHFVRRSLNVQKLAMTMKFPPRATGICRATNNAATIFVTPGVISVTDGNSSVWSASGVAFVRFSVVSISERTKQETGCIINNTN